MNIASLMNTPKDRVTQAPAPRWPRLVRVQATVLAQGAVGAMKDKLKDSVMAFRHMRDVLTGGYAQSRP